MTMALLPAATVTTPLSPPLVSCAIVVAPSTTSRGLFSSWPDNVEGAPVHRGRCRAPER